MKDRTPRVRRVNGTICGSSGGGTGRGSLDPVLAAANLWRLRLAHSGGLSQLPAARATFDAAWITPSERQAVRGVSLHTAVAT